MQISPILLEVFKNRFASIAEEMGVTLTRTAYSPNIKERRDLSCALFDQNGDMIAQAAHIPVHLGSMPLSVKAAIQSAKFEPGDMVMLNDPYKGGTHLPDITLVAPVFTGDASEPAFYVANRAHHADVGGMSPGSMPLSDSLFQEGLIIPPIKFVKRGEIDRELMGFILNNVRTPDEREGDFTAQVMAATGGVKRMGELLTKYGLKKTRLYARALQDYSEAMVREAIAAVPDGEYRFKDFLDSDGMGATDIPIEVLLNVDGNSVRLDFSRSGDQVAGSVNAVRAITLSAVLYVFRSLVTKSIPVNNGCMRPIEVITRKGSVVDARFPAAVAGGNVETSQRIVDVVLGALAQAAPEIIPAASQGTMNNTAVGGTDTRTGRPFAYYETLAGGMGASSHTPGASAVHSHMTNTLNTPVEALEYACPFRVRQYRIARGTGGNGLHRGGDGLVREIEFLSDCTATILSERRTRAPYGLNGGSDGSPGKNEVIDRSGMEPTEIMDGKFSQIMRAGTSLRITTPGGGGWGKPLK